jgi:hypothetical protein
LNNKFEKFKSSIDEHYKNNKWNEISKKI